MAVIRSEGQLVALNSPWWPIQPFSTGLRLYGNYSPEYSEIYRTQPAVRTVVDFLARNIAQLGLKVYRRTSDVEREHLGDHDLAQLLRRPNPYVSPFRFKRELVSDLAIFDSFFGAKVRTPQGLQILRVPPARVEIHGDNWFRPDFYRITGGKKNVDIQASEMLHIHGYSPDDSRTGIPPMETLRRILAEDAAAGEYREYFWKNRARSDVALMHPKELSPNAAARLKKDFDSRTTGAENSGGTVVLEEGMELKELTFSAKDSQYLEARKLTREEVASAYHVPPPMVGLLDRATFSNIDTQHRMLYQDTLAPWTIQIEEEIELQLLPEFSDTDRVYVEFNLAEKLKGSFEEQATAAQASVGAPWVTRNEQRARLNLPPLPPEEGDRIVTPLNVLIGGQASPLDATPDMRALVTQAVQTSLMRQKQVVLSKLNGGTSIESLYDRSRWQKEMADDFRVLGISDPNGKAERITEAVEQEIAIATQESEPAKALKRVFELNGTAA